MDRRDFPILGHGTTILGGAACGLSYEGALRDAIAQEDSARRREAGRHRPVAPPQTQAPWFGPAVAAMRTAEADTEAL